MSRRNPNSQETPLLSTSTAASAPYYQTLEADEVKLTDPNKVEFRQPNAHSREDIANFINSNQKADVKMHNILYWLASFGACLYQQYSNNGPNEIAIGRDWENKVYADTSAVTRVLSCITPLTTTIDLSSLTESSPFISKDNIHIVRVPAGKYGLAMIDNNPVFLRAGNQGGYHVIKTSNFAFEKLIDTNTDVIHLGNAYVINIKQGFAVVGNAPNAENEDDRFFVLTHGFRTFRSDVLKFNKQPIKTTLIQLKETVNTTTFEPVGLEIDTLLSYTINVQEALQHFDFTDLQGQINFFVKNEMHGAISTVVRTIKYTELMEFQANAAGETSSHSHAIQVNVAPKESKTDDTTVGHTLFNTLGNQINQILKEKFQKVGLTISSFSIVDICVSDKNMRAEFQNANKRVVEGRAELAAAVVNRETAIAKAEAKSSEVTISAEAYAEAEKIRARADATALETRDTALSKASVPAVQQTLFAAAGNAIKNATVFIGSDQGLIQGLASQLLGNAPNNQP